jgi:glycerophosphoryl diester phosphodiesterase
MWRGPRQIRTAHPERWAGKVDMLSIDYRTSERDVRRTLKSGIGRIWSHTVNTPAARDRMLRLGCTGIVTDAPSRLIG